MVLSAISKVLGRSTEEEEEKPVINCWGITYSDLEDLRINLIEEEKKESTTPFEQ